LGKQLVNGLEGPWGTSMNSDPKVFQKISKGGVKKGELISKTWKRGKQRSKKEQKGCVNINIAKKGPNGKHLKDLMPKFKPRPL